MGTYPRRQCLLRPGALGDALLTVPLLTQLTAANPGQELVWYQSPWTCELPWARILPTGCERVKIASFEAREIANLLADDRQQVDAEVAGWAGCDIVHIGLTPPRHLAEIAYIYCAYYHWIPAPTADLPESPHAARRLCAERCESLRLGPDWVFEDFAPTEALSTDPNQVNLETTWLINPVPQSDRCAELCLLAPGAGSRKKQLPLVHWFDLARRQQALGMQVVWLLGPAEIERGLPSLILDHNPAAELATPSLAELPDVIGRAGRFFGHDSGPSHLAGMLGIETNVFFGPTNPDVWRPLGPNVVIHRFDPTAATDHTSSTDYPAV